MRPFFRPSLIVGALPVTLTNGTTADATQVMSDFNWIVNQVNANAAPLATTALTNANNNFTVVQSGIAATSPANFPIASQIQGSVFNTFQSTLGTNSLTARMAALALTAWPTDAVFSFVPSQTNTGPANITVDSAGSSIIFSMGSTLVGGELHAGIPVMVKRDATKLNILNPGNIRFDLASSAAGGSVRMLIASTPATITIGKQPTRTIFTSGSSQTYSTPLGCVRIFVRIIGAGGGGGAVNTNNGNNGGTTSFGPMTAGGGVGGQNAGGNGGSGGSSAGGDFTYTTGGGGAGFSNTSANVAPAGGTGGGNPFGSGGSGGPGASAGFAGTVPGAGGGGGGGSAAQNSGSGGGSGGYVEKTIILPVASYIYTVGGGGSGGAAGSFAGGNGADGIIIIDEFYN